MKRKLIILLVCFGVLLSTVTGIWVWYDRDQTAKGDMEQSDVAIEEPMMIKKIPVDPIKITPNLTAKPGDNDSGDTLLVDMNGAVNVYRSQHPTAQIKGITFQDQDGKLRYEVAGVSSEAEHSVVIDGATGQVLSSDVSATNPTMKERAAIDLGDIITPEEAERVVVAMLGNRAEVLGWELQTEGYVSRYRMTLDVNGETMYVTIDANSSQIIEVVKEQ